MRIIFDMSTANIPEDIAALNQRSLDESSKDFSDLLEKINTLEPEKRRLWKDIYNNAVVDRQNAYAMFLRVVNIVQNSSSDWAIHGRTVTALLERMQKGNEALIKLAALVGASQAADDKIDPEDMFRQISKKN